MMPFAPSPLARPVISPVPVPVVPPLPVPSPTEGARNPLELVSSDLPPRGEPSGAQQSGPPRITPVPVPKVPGDPDFPQARHDSLPPRSQDSGSPARTSSRSRPPVETYNLKELKRKSMLAASSAGDLEDSPQKRRKTVAGFEEVDGEAERPSPSYYQRAEPGRGVERPSTSYASPKRSEMVNRMWASSPGEKMQEAQNKKREEEQQGKSEETDMSWTPSDESLGNDTFAPGKGAPNKAKGRGGEPVAIEAAPSGRLYRMYKVKNGRGTLLHTQGALIPDNYQNSTILGYPWVCPVRSCQRLFTTLGNMGNHWVGGHRKSLFNDNGDGTLSCIGSYGEDGQRAPGIVVSRRPLDPTEPPMAEPRPRKKGSNFLALLYASRSKDDATSRDDETEEPASFADDEDAAPTTSTAELSAGAWQMWNHVRPHLKKYTELPSSEQIRSLLPFPRVREIIWNPGQPPFADKHPKDVTSLLVQLTGDQPPVPCDRCKEGRGPYKGCYVIPSKAPLGTVLACGNCCYHGNQTRCSLRAWIIQRDRKGASSSRSSSMMLAKESSANSAESAAGRGGPAAQASAQDARPPKKRSMVETLRQSTRLSELYRPRQSQSEAAQDSAEGPEPNKSVLISKGDLRNAPPGTLMDLEEWEMSPGYRWSNTSTERKLDIVSFAKGALAAGDKHRVAPECWFQVIPIRAGGRHVFEVSDQTTRICSVAAGKVRVRVDKEDEFQIGPHGMFKVRNDLGCTVDNTLHLDAILHVTTLNSWE